MPTSGLEPQLTASEARAQKIRTLVVVFSVLTFFVIGGYAIEYTQFLSERGFTPAQCVMLAKPPVLVA